MMFQHFIFLLYLLSYISGIGAITLGFFLYKYKFESKALKYFLYADAFLTLTLSFNTLNYYKTLTNFQEQLFFSYLFIYGLLFSNFGCVLFLALAISSLLDTKVSARQKMLYIISVVFALAAVAAFHRLIFCGVLEANLGIHAACFITTAFCTSGVWYNVHYLLSNVNKISEALRPAMRALGLIGLFIAIAALAADLLGFFRRWDYPIALSPIAYFVLNLLAITIIPKYYSGLLKADTEKIIPENPAVQPDYEGLCQSYGITQRELEIILLIADGKSNQEISEGLYISLNTTRNHIYNIYKKLGVKKRRELIFVLNNKEQWPEKSHSQ